MPRKVKITADEDEIRRWINARGGWPAMVQHAGSPGELRIVFPDSFQGEKAKEISWVEFCEKFDDAGLALEFEERDEEGGLSEFHRLISRKDVADMHVEAMRRPTRAAGRRLERLAARVGEPGTERLSEGKSHQRKKNARSLTAGGKEKKKKIRKAA